MSGTKLELERIVFIGRTYEEYLQMFDLSQAELAGKKILDCPSGACSFVAVASQFGAEAMACDIVYDHDVDALEQKGLSDIAHTMAHMEQAQENYSWGYFGNVEGLRTCRTQALTDCVADLRSHPERYVQAVLPVVPFAERQFDLTLSAHFLFLYADRLDYDFHVQALQELMRVTKAEIRIFPTIDLQSQRYERMDALLAIVQEHGWSAEEVQVPYEFQRNGNTMLKLKRVK